MVNKGNDNSFFQTADAKRSNLFDNIVSKSPEELGLVSKKAKKAVSEAFDATCKAVVNMEAFTAKNTNSTKDAAMISWEEALEKARAALKAVELAYENASLQMAGDKD